MRPDPGPRPSRDRARAEPAPNRNVLEVAQRMGLEVRRGGRWSPCPVCKGDRDGEGRGPLRITPTGWWCNACNTNGVGAVGLVSWWMLGREPTKGDSELRRVYEFLDGPSDRPAPERPRPAPTPVPTRPSGDPADIAAFLRVCAPVAQDPACAAFLRGRSIDPEYAPAGAVPVGLERPWWPRSWSTTWRVVVGAYDARGALRSVHARAIDGTKPKTRWALNLDATGLVFANRAGRALLRGEGDPPRKLLVTEGLPDFLDASAQLQDEAAVLSVESGSAVLFEVARIPKPVEIYVATHADAAGNAYAQRVAEALAVNPVPQFARRVPLDLLRRRSRRAA